MFNHKRVEIDLVWQLSGQVRVKMSWSSTSKELRQADAAPKHREKTQSRRLDTTDEPDRAAGTGTTLSLFLGWFSENLHMDFFNGNRYKQRSKGD
jgi:hypothetical protein